MKKIERFENEPNCFLFELWPSTTEIRTSKKMNAYLQEFTEFYESYNCLMDAVSKEYLPLVPMVGS